MPDRNKPRRFDVLLIRLWVWWDVWLRDLIVVVAIALSLWSTAITQQTLGKQEKQQRAAAAESVERRDQNCLLFERSQQRSVQALANTYKYLGGLTPRQLAEPLNRAVLANLPQTISEAQTADAPPYCDDPGVGLPEPNPVVPKPPKGLRPK